MCIFVPLRSVKMIVWQSGRSPSCLTWYQPSVSEHPRPLLHSLCSPRPWTPTLATTIIHSPDLLPPPSTKFLSGNTSLSSSIPGVELHSLALIAHDHLSRIRPRRPHCRPPAPRRPDWTTIDSCIVNWVYTIVLSRSEERRVGKECRN